MILMLAYAIHKSSWIVKSSSFLEVEAFYGDGKDNKEEERQKPTSNATDTPIILGP